MSARPAQASFRDRRGEPNDQQRRTTASSSTTSRSRSWRRRAAKIYCGAKPGDYFELKGEMLHPAAGTGLLDLLARGAAAAACRQAARRRIRTTGCRPTPRSPAPTRTARRGFRITRTGKRALLAMPRRRPCRSPRNRRADAGRTLRPPPGLRDLARHPRRLAARRRPWRASTAARRSTTSSPSARPASPPSTAPTSTPASRS